VQDPTSFDSPAPARPIKRATRWWLGGALAIAVVVGFAHFARARDSNAGALEPPRPAAAPVAVAVVARRDMPVVERTIGTVLANATVDVSARVGGLVESAQFHEGDVVQAGDELFAIDRRPYQAALDAAQAELAKDEAQLRNLEASERRYRQIYAQRLATPEQLDAAVAAAAGAAATVQADRAAVELAELNLDYTRIRSPIAGKTGPILVHPGNLVSANGATPLVTIEQVRPVKVSFALPQSDLPRIQARALAGGLVASIEAHAEGGGRVTAPVDFVSNRIDAATGTIELRATFANDDAALVPGEVVNVEVELADLPGATVVPRAAVNAGPDGLYAFAVEADGRAAQRAVKVLFDDGTDAAIEGDLRPGERVIVEGQLRVVPGALVRVGAAATSPAAGT
jgi:multidrug efflux system membrane fusion protein